MTKYALSYEGEPRLRLTEVLVGKDGVNSTAAHTLFFRQGTIIDRVATGQGKVREIQGQGISELVREIWNFVESQGNLRKVREI